MKNELFTKYIGNPLFCDAWTALDLATKPAYLSKLKDVLLRPDIEPSVVIENIHLVNSIDAVDCLNREDVKQYLNALSEEEIYAIVVKNNNWSFLKFVTQQQRVIDYLNRLSIYELLKLISKINEIAFFQFAIEKLNVTNRTYSEIDSDEALLIGDKYSHWMVWSLILNRLNIPIKDVLKKAHEISNWRVWMVVIVRPDLPEKEALRLAKKLDEIDVWLALLSRLNKKDSIKYASKGNNGWLAVISKPMFSAKEAFEIIEKYNLRYDHFVVAINKPGLSFDSALALARSKSNKFRMYYFAERHDLEENLLTMNLDSAEKLAEEIGNAECWKIYFKRPDLEIEKSFNIIKKHRSCINIFLKNPTVSQYISELPMHKAVKIGNTLNLDEYWIHILKRDSLTPKEKIDCAREINQIEIWKSIFEDELVIEYLKSNNSRALIYFAKTVNNPVVWSTILSLPLVINTLLIKMSPKEAIKYSHEIDCEQIYNVIFNRADVKLYLNSNE